MAIGATIFRVELQVSDLDRNYFAAHSLRLARHPSETDERMMVRLLAFALNAHEHLAFGPGLSTEDEADLTLMDLTGAIDAWIDVGLPDERRVRKASGRSKRVAVYTYGGRAAQMWWNANAAGFERLANLSVFDLTPETTKALAARADRNMAVSCTVQDGHIYLEQDGATLEIAPRVLK
ncbi:hypothetical protein BWI17_11595 [Betaproteobacteria bacterium GR16-43]|nr:hypothetical protein BWI17_11595 [Betaproteobacteria bacterium GR16-43]